MARSKRRGTARGGPNWSTRAVIAGLAVLLVVTGVALMAGRTDSGPGPGTASGSGGGSGQQQEFDLARRTDGDVTALGEVDAPVVMVEFADFRCPFCGVFARDTMPQLVEEYVESGQLRIEWRDMPVFGQQSVDAAVAARAAGEQGRFWEFHAAVFAEAPERGHLTIDRGRILTIAKRAGVPDIATFERDLDSESLLKAVRQDAAQAQAVGVSSTPVFVIGNTPVVGAQPVETFREAVDRELAVARGDG